MSCCIVLKHNDELWLAADGRSTDNSYIVPYSTPKIVRNNGVWIGFAGARACQQAIAYSDIMPGVGTVGDNLEVWIVDHWIQQAKKSLRSAGLLRVENGLESAEFSAILCVQERFCVVWGGDFAVHDSSIPFAAIGSGERLALGAMQVMLDIGRWEPAAVLETALKVVADHDSSVGPPFTIKRVWPE